MSTRVQRTRIKLSKLLISVELRYSQTPYESMKKPVKDVKSPRILKFSIFFVKMAVSWESGLVAIPWVTTSGPLKRKVLSEVGTNTRGGTPGI